LVKEDDIIQHNYTDGGQEILNKWLYLPMD
jgi:hypothetical protein